jgi:hypothetical protein
MKARERYEFTPIRVVFWLVNLGILFSVAVFVAYPLVRGLRFPSLSEKPGCLLTQRNLQQAARSYANMEGLKPGDPLDWSKIIGPGLLLERKPACPVHGESAYTYSPVIPEPGTLAAPCRDPEHRPADTKDW